MKKKNKRNLRLKKFYFHPITIFLVLIIVTVIASAILSFFQMQGSYSTIDATNNTLNTTLVTVENMLSFDGSKLIFSNALRSFLSFAPLGMLLVTLIGIGISKSTGFLDVLCKRVFNKVDKRIMTFIIIFLAIISSLINDIGYVLLIPLAAIIFQANNRNPYVGMIAAFCGVSFGYGISIFVGSMEVNLIPYTTMAARLIDSNAHISLTSNLFIIIGFSVILAIIGTFIIEKIIIPRMGKYKEESSFTKTEEMQAIDIEEAEQLKIEQEKKEKKGLRRALITGLIIVILFIYMLIPNLPYSGLLLDMTEDTYLGQLFGANSYFQDGFTYMITLLLVAMGLAYGLSAKTVKNDKEIIAGCKEIYASMGEMILLLFVSSQFISIFRQTNIGTVISSWCADAINNISFTGIPLIIFVIIIVAIASLFLTSSTTKWEIFSPIVVPAFMQANLSPQFTQFIFRVGDSIAAGLTPLLPGFIIYLGFLNMYNKDLKKPISIHKGISYVLPYFGIMAISWILLTIGWYLIGLPIGPNVYPTL